MRTEIKHTPTPWVASCPDGHAPTIYGPGDAYVGTVGWSRRNKALEIKQADARHIVKCVNNHDELVGALEGMVATAKNAKGFETRRGYHAIAQADTALAKVNQ